MHTLLARSFCWCAVACALGVLAGCTKRDIDQWYAGPPIITVRSSSLNWVEIYYSETATSVPVRVDMRAEGMVTIYRGRSSQVMDSFAYDYDSTNWNDQTKKVVTLSRNTFQYALQSLVNAGLLVIEEEPEEGDPKPTQKVMVRGHINDREFDKYVFNEDLILEIETQIFHYLRDAPRL